MLFHGVRTILWFYSLFSAYKHSWEPLFCILSIFVDFCVLPPFKMLIPCYKTFINLLDSMLKLANSSFFLSNCFYPLVFLSNCFYPHIFLSNNNFFISPFLSTKQLFICFFYPLFLSKSKTYPRFLSLFYPRKCFYPISVYPHRCCLSRTPGYRVSRKSVVETVTRPPGILSHTCFANHLTGLQ